VYVVCPVPPLLAAIAVAFHVPVVIVPSVIILVDPTQVDNAVFSTLLKPTAVLSNVCQVLSPLQY
jgi:hypothetical protein